MKMLNKYDTANSINIWLSEISEDATKEVKSVSLVNDGDPNGSYILAVVLYEPVFGKE